MNKFLVIKKCKFLGKSHDGQFVWFHEIKFEKELENNELEQLENIDAREKASNLRQNVVYYIEDFFNELKNGDIFYYYYDAFYEVGEFNVKLLKR